MNGVVFGPQPSLTIGRPHFAPFPTGTYPSVADDAKTLAAELWRRNADFYGLDVPARLHDSPDLTPAGRRLHDYFLASGRTC